MSVFMITHEGAINLGVHVYPKSCSCHCNIRDFTYKGMVTKEIIIKLGKNKEQKLALMFTCQMFFLLHMFFCQSYFSDWFTPRLQ